MTLFKQFIFKYKLRLRRPNGYLAYEYHPLFNLRDTEGNLKEFTTKRLNFDINHPVDIETLPSYDGSVNLILNDGYNMPRLINTRFSPIGKNKYEIIDRIGNTDTNIYDDTEEQFEIDTSLYKRILKIPIITYNGVYTSGDLKVGNYVFYFTYCDADENETDFVGESSIVSIFKGNDCDPFSIDGGERDMNANKSVCFSLSNIDSAYDYVKVYYTRTSAEHSLNRVTSAYKISKKYTIRNNSCDIIINGTEETELITTNDINVQYFIADKVNTLAQCLNMLFMANIEKPTIEYAKLTNLSLHIIPNVVGHKGSNFIGQVDPSDYFDNTQNGGYEYYNTQNIYNKVGYWPEEIYRFGIVYIMNDGSLSPVFNILGRNNMKPNDVKYCTYTPSSLDFTIDQTDYSIKEVYGANAKGVIRFIDSNIRNINETVYGISFNINQALKIALSELNVSGYFFVRLKRIPSIIAQAFTLGYEKISHTPLLPYNNLKSECIINKGGMLDSSYEERLYDVGPIVKSNKLTAICPEFMYNLPLYNLFFTGSEYKFRKISNPMTLARTNYNERIYYALDNLYNPSAILKTKIVAVTNEASSVAIEDTIFKGTVGDASTAYKTSYIKMDLSDNKGTYGKKCPSNIIRGIFSPYLGLVTSFQIEPANLINIYLSGYDESKMKEYFNIRYEDSSAFMAVSDRKSINQITDTNEVFRGDCYICTFTWRMNRNFSDPVSPTNEIFIDPKCWKDNYSMTNSTNLSKINLGDVDAVSIGSWITFRLRCSTNLSIRSSDSSNVTEANLYGNPRSYYPLSQLTIEGNNKIPQSSLFNDGFRTTLSERYNFTLPYSPYYKNRFQNRVLYSDIAINDAYKNGYRIFREGDYADYSTEYGSITKLVEWQGDLLCVFEHGIARIPVNEKAILQNIQSGVISIQANTVIPSELNSNYILTNMYGSQWKDSIIATPYNIYGVDTIAKKIWRINSRYQIEVLSDLKVNKFIVDNITLGERKLQPIIGLRNVKTHYNANKGDIMFTFYNPKEIYDDETSWNLCFNETLNKWVTFYSWIPEISANIDNVMFTFDRDYSRNMAKLYETEVPGIEDNLDNLIKMSSHIFKLDEIEGKDKLLPYDVLSTTRPDLIKALDEASGREHETYRAISENKNLVIINDTGYIFYEGEFPKYKILGYSNGKFYFEKYRDTSKSEKLYFIDLVKDGYTYIPYLDGSKGDNDLFQINESDDGRYLTSSQLDTLDRSKPYKIYLIMHGTKLSNKDILLNDIRGCIYVTFKETLNKEPDQLWKHGSAGIYDHVEGALLPTNWYGELHPFEFEFVVRDTPNISKIFDNLEIISNKAEPESFHYEIVGESYEFHNDKINMYYRQEETKESFNKLGSRISYDENYKLIKPSLNYKSTIFPLYYNRIDVTNLIYDNYVEMAGDNKDYSALSGSELKYDKDSREFHICTHIKNLPIDVFDRLRGNSQYKEDRWRILIPSITFELKNEKKWNDAPPIVITGIPDDLNKDKVKDLEFINNIFNNKLDITKWTLRKEAKIKDKYMKVKIRYSGKDLAIISGVITLYRESYA